MSNKLSKDMESKIARIKYCNITIFVCLAGITCIQFSTNTLVTFGIGAVTVGLSYIFLSKMPKRNKKHENSED